MNRYPVWKLRHHFWFALLIAPVVYTLAQFLAAPGSTGL
jgi:hypothetical protein